MTVEGLAHVGILVSELEAAQRFCGRLGLETEGPEEDEELGVFLLWARAGETVLEFVAPARPDSRAAAALERGEAGVHHIALRVRGLDGLLAELQVEGVPVRDETPRRGAHGSRVAFLSPEAAGGALFELVE